MDLSKLSKDFTSSSSQSYSVKIINDNQIEEEAIENLDFWSYS